MEKKRNEKALVSQHATLLCFLSCDSFRTPPAIAPMVPCTLAYLLLLLQNSEKKFEEAYELCNDAANLFKINKRFDRAAEAYQKAADMQFKLNTPHEAARCYIDAATMIKKADPKGACVTRRRNE